MFGDFTDVTAIGSTGLVWRTRVALDGFTLLRIENGYLHGTCRPSYVSPEGDPFRVELATGRYEGRVLWPTA
jgi:hypothetical protein